MCLKNERRDANLGVVTNEPESEGFRLAKAAHADGHAVHVRNAYRAIDDNVVLRRSVAILIINQGRERGTWIEYTITDPEAHELLSQGALDERPDHARSELSVGETRSSA